MSTALAGEAPLVVTRTSAETAFWTDLAMGAWSAGHAAHEIAAQLGITLDARDDDADASTINRGVDREARGDGTLIAAFDAARRIAAAMPRDGRIVLIRPCFGLPMRADNRALLRYLTQLGIVVRCLPRARENQVAIDLPELARVHPGLIEPRVLATMGVADDHSALIRTADGRFCVDPAVRDIDPRRKPMLIDRLSAFEGGDARLFAYCQCLGSPLFVESPRLAAAAQATVQGAADLALDLAAKARACARTAIEVAQCDLHLQGMRIFLHRFDAVAAMPNPSPRLPEPLRQELFTLRGWGKVMTGDVAEAERCFAESGDSEADATGLYGRNIAALARFKAGDIVGARAIEEAIADDLLAQDDPDQQLCFVNALNLARLGRASGDDEYYRAAVARAFATSDNVRSISEIIQLNWLEGEALAVIDPARARLSWLRSALAWLALQPPEALSIRALRALLGHAAVPPRRIDARGAAQIAARLAAAWPGVLPLVLDEVPQVRLSDDAPALPLTKIIAIDGAALGCSAERRPMLPRAPEILALAAHAFAIIASEAGTTLHPAAGSWTIDAVNGCDVRAGRGDVVASHWLRGLAVDAAGVTVGIGPAVRSAVAGPHSVALRFKRHRPPLTLFGGHADLFAAITAAGRTPVDALSATSAAMVRDLVEQRALGLSSDAA
ncbi:hypothetical protein BH10PSE14_BH10PSE14_20820 [soil metagenome]